MFEVLLDIMTFSKDLENMVEGAIEEFIIQKIKRETKLTDYPAAMFEDLSTFTEINTDSYCPFLKSLYDENVMRDWIGEITD